MQVCIFSFFDKHNTEAIKNDVMGQVIAVKVGRFPNQITLYTEQNLQTQHHFNKVPGKLSAS